MAKQTAKQAAKNASFNIAEISHLLREDSTGHALADFLLERKKRPKPKFGVLTKYAKENRFSVEAPVEDLPPPLACTSLTPPSEEQEKDLEQNENAVPAAATSKCAAATNAGTIESVLNIEQMKQKAQAPAEDDLRRIAIKRRASKNGLAPRALLKEFDNVDMCEVTVNSPNFLPPINSTPFPEPVAVALHFLNESDGTITSNDEECLQKIQEVNDNLEAELQQAEDVDLHRLREMPFILKRGYSVRKAANGEIVLSHKKTEMGCGFNQLQQQLNQPEQQQQQRHNHSQQQIQPTVQGSAKKLLESLLTKQTPKSTSKINGCIGSNSPRIPNTPEQAIIADRPLREETFCVPETQDAANRSPNIVINQVFRLTTPTKTKSLPQICVKETTKVTEIAGEVPNLQVPKETSMVQPLITEPVTSTSANTIAKAISPKLSVVDSIALDFVEITDDESDGVITEDGVTTPKTKAIKQKKPHTYLESSNVPLNLATSESARRRKHKPLRKSNANTSKSKSSRTERKLTLNRAPCTPINGELFARELARMSNQEILDLRRRNSNGEVCAFSWEKPVQKNQLKERQRVLKKHIDKILRKRRTQSNLNVEDDLPNADIVNNDDAIALDTQQTTNHIVSADQMAAEEPFVADLSNEDNIGHVNTQTPLIIDAPAEFQDRLAEIAYARAQLMSPPLSTVESCTTHMRQQCSAAKAASLGTTSLLALSPQAQEVEAVLSPRISVIDVNTLKGANTDLQLPTNEQQEPLVPCTQSSPTQSLPSKPSLRSNSTLSSSAMLPPPTVPEPRIRKQKHKSKKNPKPAEMEESMQQYLNLQYSMMAGRSVSSFSKRSLYSKGDSDDEQSVVQLEKKTAQSSKKLETQANKSTKSSAATNLREIAEKVSSLNLDKDLQASCSLLPTLPPPNDFSDQQATAVVDDNAFKKPTAPPPRKRKHQPKKQTKMSIVEEEEEEVDSNYTSNLRRSKRTVKPVTNSASLYIQEKLRYLFEKSQKQSLQKSAKQKQLRSGTSSAFSLFGDTDLTSSNASEASNVAATPAAVVVSTPAAKSKKTKESRKKASATKSRQEIRAAELSTVYEDVQPSCSSMAPTTSQAARQQLLAVRDAPVDCLNDLFDSIKNASAAVEPTTSATNTTQIVSMPMKNLRVRLKRVNSSKSSASAATSGVESNSDEPGSSVGSDDAVAASTNSQYELTRWLHNLPQGLKNQPHIYPIFKDMQIFSKDKVTFTEVDGIKYAFYDSECSLGYLSFEPKFRKGLKKTKQFHLHFVVLTGQFRFYTERENGIFNPGDIIAIPIGTRYDVANLVDERSFLMIIKKKELMTS